MGAAASAAKDAVNKAGEAATKAVNTAANTLLKGVGTVAVAAAEAKAKEQAGAIVVSVAEAKDIAASTSSSKSQGTVIVEGPKVEQTASNAMGSANGGAIGDFDWLPASGKFNMEIKEDNIYANVLKLFANRGMGKNRTAWHGTRNRLEIGGIDNAKHNVSMNMKFSLQLPMTMESPNYLADKLDTCFDDKGVFNNTKLGDNFISVLFSYLTDSDKICECSHTIPDGISTSKSANVPFVDLKNFVKNNPAFLLHWYQLRNYSPETLNNITSALIYKVNSLINYVLTTDLRKPNTDFKIFVEKLFSGDNRERYSYASGMLMLPSLLGYLLRRIKKPQELATMFGSLGYCAKGESILDGKRGQQLYRDDGKLTTADVGFKTWNYIYKSMPPGENNYPFLPPNNRNEVVHIVPTNAYDWVLPPKMKIKEFEDRFNDKLAKTVIAICSGGSISIPKCASVIHYDPYSFSIDASKCFEKIGNYSYTKGKTVVKDKTVWYKNGTITCKTDKIITVSAKIIQKWSSKKVNYKIDVEDGTFSVDCYRLTNPSNIQNWITSKANENKNKKKTFSWSDIQSVTYKIGSRVTNVNTCFWTTVASDLPKRPA